jgi:hypothetical protein
MVHATCYGILSASRVTGLHRTLYATRLSTLHGLQASRSSGPTSSGRIDCRHPPDINQRPLWVMMSPERSDRMQKGCPAAAGLPNFTWAGCADQSHHDCQVPLTLITSNPLL